MTAMIPEKRRINPILRAGIALSERVTGKRMLPARLLAWYPRAAVSSGVLESLITHKDKGATARELKLIRMAVSLTAECPFCVDMNSHEYAQAGLTDTEALALQRGSESECPSFTPREQAAIAYARAASGSPLQFDDELRQTLARLFTPREIVILATTAAQVNYWARLIQGLGIPPAGFSDQCAIS